MIPRSAGLVLAALATACFTTTAGPSPAPADPPAPAAAEAPSPSEPAIATPAPAALTWRCTLSTGDALAFDGPCLVAEEASTQTTTLSAPDGGALAQWSVLTLSVVDGRTVEVRGLTAEGVNSRFGAASVSKRDDACWEGDDFTVCAYRP